MPASCSRNTPMICSSLKRLRRMVLLLISRPNLSVAGMPGSTSANLHQDIDNAARRSPARRATDEQLSVSRVGQIAALAAARRYSHRIQDMEGPLLMSSGGTTIRAVLFLATLSQPDTPPSRSPY